mmetsp:Transcript_12772/g.36545  ORF Transcript_12772/g.36545 Transcript_12772/m.36545 type:complete len:373 (-) Transcript_12772:118-1236(-)
MVPCRRAGNHLEDGRQLLEMPLLHHLIRLVEHKIRKRRIVIQMRVPVAHELPVSPGSRHHNFGWMLRDQPLLLLVTDASHDGHHPHIHVPCNRIQCLEHLHAQLPRRHHDQCAEPGGCQRPTSLFCTLDLSFFAQCGQNWQPKRQGLPGPRLRRPDDVHPISDRRRQALCLNLRRGHETELCNRLQNPLLQVILPPRTNIHALPCGRHLLLRFPFLFLFLLLPSVLASLFFLLLLVLLLLVLLPLVLRDLHLCSRRARILPSISTTAISVILVQAPAHAPQPSILPLQLGNPGGQHVRGRLPADPYRPLSSLAPLLILITLLVAFNELATRCLCPLAPSKSLRTKNLPCKGSVQLLELHEAEHVIILVAAEY